MISGGVILVNLRLFVCRSLRSVCKARYELIRSRWTWLLL